MKIPLRYRAVRKFPSNSSAFSRISGEEHEHVSIETTGGIAYVGDDCMEEDGVDEDDFDYDNEDSDDNNASMESEETTFKKLKLTEDARTLRTISTTEDFVNFLCYRKYEEPENASEQRKMISEFFEEENSSVKNKFDATNFIADHSKKSLVKDELLTDIPHIKCGNFESVHKTMKRKLCTKNEHFSRASFASPTKKSPKNKKEDILSSLKNRLRPSTKALTAATDREQFLNVKRKLSLEFHLSSSEESCEVEVSCLPSCAHKTSEELTITQGKYQPDEGCSKLKSISLVSATNGDFADIHIYITHLISSKTQPAFLVQPPNNFKIECNISQHIRISTHNQYVHRFCNRWGRNSIQLACILCYLDSHETGFSSHPLAGGVEIDLVGLSDAICKHEGLQKVIDNVLWSDVIKSMRVPKMTRDKIARFYEVYCRYLLPFDTLSQKEKLKLEKKVLNCSNSSCCDDLCVSKGRCRTLNELYDVACNIASMFDLDEASFQEVLSTYWKIVKEADPHVTVHTGFIKPSEMLKRRSSTRNKTTLASHLKCCASTSCPIICDEDVLGSRLEVEMMFSTRCWTTDRHARGTIFYHHTGADIVWYFVSANDEDKLKKALKGLVPDLIDLSLKYWLPPNTVMIHPERLMQHGVHVWKVVQQSGQLVVIPPNVFFSSVSSGYSISEHIHFLPHDWLPAVSKSFINLHADCHEAMFSLERFVFLMLANECYQLHHCLNSKAHLSNSQTNQALNLLEKFISKELKLRKALLDLGVMRKLERVLAGEERGTERWMGKILKHEMAICHLTKDFCFFSLVKDAQNNLEYCLECAAKQLLKKKSLNSYELVISFTQSELSEVVSKVKKFQRL